MLPPARRSPAVALSLPLLAALTAGCESGGVQSSALQGRYIATISDADELTTVGGELAATGTGGRDALTVITLPIAEGGEEEDRWQTEVAQVDVSNSVLGPPRALSVSRDGSRAYVVETFKPGGAEPTPASRMTPGTLLTAVSLADAASPVVTGTADVGSMPMSCDVHPDGDVVAVATTTPGQQLVLVPVSAGDGALGEPLVWPLIGIDDPEVRPSCVAWHPSGRYLAVTLPDVNQVVFYEFVRDGMGGMGLARWGMPVPVGRYPYSGSFTPDGRFFVTADMQWGADGEDFMIGASEGTLTVVRVSDVATEMDAPEPVRHEVVSTASVGVSPEGLAISPDGSLVAVANLRRSYLPASDPRVTPGGSISLLRLDRGAGSLTPVGETEIAAIPQGLAFDRSGRFLVVTQFRSFDPRAVDGELAFFRVESGTPGGLVELNFVVGVGTGPHGVVVVR